VIRRATALLSFALLLQLDVAAGAMTCASHIAVGQPSAPDDHEHHQHHGDAPEPTSAPAPCDTLATCAVSVDLPSTDRVSSAVGVAGEPGLQPAERVTSRAVSAPEPPPPKALAV
jgi:hypothetical protein